MKLSELLAMAEERTQISAQWDDPDFLSNLLLELASLYSSLAKPLADYEQEEDAAENQLKVARALTTQDRIKGGEAIERAKAAAISDTVDDFASYSQVRHKARWIFLTRQNLDKTMDAIRSRLSYIKRDWEGTKHGV